jgi:hypothetical protein
MEGKTVQQGPRQGMDAELAQRVVAFAMSRYAPIEVKEASNRLFAASGRDPKIVHKTLGLAERCAVECSTMAPGPAIVFIGAVQNICRMVICDPDDTEGKVYAHRFIDTVSMLGKGEEHANTIPHQRGLIFASNRLLARFEGQTMQERRNVLESITNLIAANLSIDEERSAYQTVSTVLEASQRIRTISIIPDLLSLFIKDVMYKKLFEIKRAGK